MSHSVCAACGYTNDPGDPCICETKDALWRVRFDATPEERTATRRKIVGDVIALRNRVRELKAENNRLREQLNTELTLNHPELRRPEEERR